MWELYVKVWVLSIGGSIYEKIMIGWSEMTEED